MNVIPNFDHRSISYASLLLATFFSVIQTSNAVAEEKSLPEALPPSFPIGFQAIGVNEKGEDSAITLSEETETTRTWKRDDGCSWTSLKIGYAPSVKWSGCGGSDGGYNSKLVDGQPYPIKLGGKWTYVMDGWNEGGSTWSDQRVCEVEGIEKVTVPMGTFAAYKIVCRENTSVRTYHRAPEVGYAVKYERDSSRSGLTSWGAKKLVTP